MQEGGGGRRCYSSESSQTNEQSRSNSPLLLGIYDVPQLMGASTKYYVYHSICKLRHKLGAITASQVVLTARLTRYRLRLVGDIVENQVPISNQHEGPHWRRFQFMATPVDVFLSSRWVVQTQSARDGGGARLTVCPTISYSGTLPSDVDKLQSLL